MILSVFLDLLKGVEGVAVDRLAFGIGLVRRERAVGDPGNGGSGEVEPRNLRDI